MCVRGWFCTFYYKISIKLLFECEREGRTRRICGAFFLSHAAGTKGGKVREMLIMSLWKNFLADSTLVWCAGGHQWELSEEEAVSRNEARRCVSVALISASA